MYLYIYRSRQDEIDNEKSCEVLNRTATELRRAKLLMSAIKVQEKMIELYPECEYSNAAFPNYSCDELRLQVYSPVTHSTYKLYPVFPVCGNCYEQDRERPKRNKKVFDSELATYADRCEEASEITAEIIGYIEYLEATEEHESALRNANGLAKLLEKTRPEIAALAEMKAGEILVRMARDEPSDENLIGIQTHFKAFLKRYHKHKFIDLEIRAWVHLGDSYKQQKEPDLKKANKAYQKADSLYEASQAAH